MPLVITPEKAAVPDPPVSVAVQLLNLVPEIFISPAPLMLVKVASRSRENFEPAAIVGTKFLTVVSNTASVVEEVVRGGFAMPEVTNVASLPKKSVERELKVKPGVALVKVNWSGDWDAKDKILVPVS